MAEGQKVGMLLQSGAGDNPRGSANINRANCQQLFYLENGYQLLLLVHLLHSALICLQEHNQHKHARLPMVHQWISGQSQ